MKAPKAKETMNWAVVALMGMGVYWIGSKMGLLPDWLRFSTPALAAGSGSGDSYSEQMDRINEQVEESTESAVETRQGWIDYYSYYEQQGYFYYHPEIRQAYDDYMRELDEYIDVVSQYPGGGENDYARVWSEYRDVQTADEKLRALIQGVLS